MFHVESIIFPLGSLCYYSTSRLHLGYIYHCINQDRFIFFNILIDAMK